MPKLPVIADEHAMLEAFVFNAHHQGLDEFHVDLTPCTSEVGFKFCEFIHFFTTGSPDGKARRCR